MAENVLELALRGRPVDPFYMVRCMGDQSVVIRAEEGRSRMLVGDEVSGQEKVLVCDARKDINHDNKRANLQGIRSATENRGRIVDLDFKQKDPLPPLGHRLSRLIEK